MLYGWQTQEQVCANLTHAARCRWFDSPPAKRGFSAFIKALLLFFSLLFSSPLLSSPLVHFLLFSSLLFSPLLSSPLLPQLPAPDRNLYHNCKCTILMGTTGPQQQAPDRSGYTGPQQQAPDRKRQIAVDAIYRQAPEPSGLCRASAASARSQWARTSTTISRSQWAVYRTSTASCSPSQWALPDLQWALLDLNRCASSRSQWALTTGPQPRPGLNRKRQIAVSTTGTGLQP